MKFKVIVAEYQEDSSGLLHKFENKSRVIAKSIKYFTTVASPLLAEYFWYLRLRNAIY